MIQLLQIINHMFNLEYSQYCIDDAFTAVINGDESLDTLLDVIGVELTESQYKTLKAKLPLYESALHVVQMRREAC